MNLVRDISIDLAAIEKSAKENWLANQKFHIRSLIESLYSNEANRLWEIRKHEISIRVENEALEKIRSKLVKVIAGDWEIIDELNEDYNKAKR